MRTIRGRGVVVFTWLFISSKYLIWIAHQRHWKTKNLEASSGADVLSIELFRSYISFFSANLNFLVMITGKIFLQSLFAHPQNRQPLDFFFFFLSFSLVLCLLRKHPIDISGVHDGRSPSSLRIESLIHIAFLDLCNSSYFQLKLYAQTGMHFSHPISISRIIITSLMKNCYFLLQAGFPQKQNDKVISVSCQFLQPARGFFPFQSRCCLYC